jgi:hypothetical protein
MTGEEFRELEIFIREQFELIGAADLGSEELYLVRDTDEATRRRPDARTVVLEMLKTLDRYLAAQDRRTYEKSLFIISRSISGPGPERILLAGC